MARSGLPRKRSRARVLVRTERGQALPWAQLADYCVEVLEPRQMLCGAHLDTANSALTYSARLAPASSAQGAALTTNELAVVSVTPLNGSQSVARNTVLTITFNIPISSSTLNAGTFDLRDASNTTIPGTLTYNAATSTATFSPATPLPITNGYYTARVRGGSTGVNDTIGNNLQADFTWSFTTGVTTFTETTVVSNLQNPTAVRFAPDGRVFVAEKSGIIKEFDNLADPTPTVVADLRTEVHNFWDRGLLGLALDPNFATSNYVYVLYAYDADLGGVAPKWGQPNTTADSAGPSPTTTGATISGRIARLTLTSASVMVPGSEKVLVEDWQQQFYTHSVGTLAFGPDGALYASAGDGASPEFADYGQVANGFGDPANEGGALRSQDLRTPNDPTSLDGSVIRINPATGAALSTNPNYLTGHDENARRIISYGFRNPYRFTLRPGTSEIWLSDVGWNDWEEINRISAPTTRVENFGWPAYEGNGRQPGYEAANLPLLNSLYAQGPAAVTSPYFTYQHTQQVVPGSDEPIGGSSVTGLAFYTGGTYPAAFSNALFFDDYARQRIWAMNIGPDGLPDPATRKVVAIASGPVDLQIGPNGDLFYVDFNNGTVRRLQYFSGNRPPVASASVDKTEGATPLTVQFNAAASSDPDAGDTLGYAWDLDGDGQFNDSTAVNPSRTYATPGNVTVRVRVTDAGGFTDTASVLISVGNTTPLPTILSPSAAVKWSVGSVISFTGLASDNEEGTLAPSRLSWTLSLHHDNLINPANSHIHVIESFTGVSGGSFVAPDHGYPSRLELFLTATDANGLSATTSVVLSPQTVALNVGSAPAGIQVALNGDAYTAPFTATVIAGSSSSLSVPAQQAIAGVTYRFGFWSDGGSASHNIVVGNADTSMSVTYVPVAADVTTGLVDRWTLDEGTGTVAADSIGTASGTLTNGPTWTTGRVGTSALLFDGVNDYVSTATDLATTLGTSPATLTAWIKTTQVGDDLFWQAPGITGVEQASGNFDTFWGWIDGSGHVGVQAGDGAAAKSLNPVNDGQWHFVAFSRDPVLGQLQVWVDGVFNTAVGGWQNDRNTPIRSFGRIDDTGGTPTYYRGALDDLRVYNRVLTSGDISSIFNASIPNTPPAFLTSPPTSITVSGKTQGLSVLGSDDLSEASLTYAWSTVGTPPAQVTFAASGTNAARTTVATFAKAGAYTLRVTITDLGGLTATADIAVTVLQTATSLSVSPGVAPLLPAGQQQQFTAVVKDQFGDVLTPQPPVTWVLTSGAGTLSPTGLYTAGGTPGSSYIITATSGEPQGTATGTVLSADGLVSRWNFEESSGPTVIDTASGNSGTISGGPTRTAGVVGTGAMTFDGVDDYVALPNDLAPILGVNAATVAAWIKTTQVGDDSMWQAPGITGVEQAGGDQDTFWGWIDGSGRIGIQSGDGPYAKSPNPINDGRWHHVAFSRDSVSGLLQTWVDGLLVASVYSWQSARITPIRSFGRIDDTAGTPTYFNGTLDDLRVYNRVLTNADVSAIASANAVSGVIFQDRNSSGDRDANEPAMAGATVYLDSNLDGLLTPGEPTTLSLVDGSYKFMGLASGATSRVRVALPTGFVAVGPVSVGVDAITGSTGNDLGLFPTTFSAVGDYTLRLDGTGTSTQILLGGSVQYTVPKNIPSAFNFSPTSAGADSLTIDLTNGDPIPAGGMNFDGGAGTNTLAVTGSSAADTFSVSATTLTINGKPATFAAGTSAINVAGGVGNDALALTATPAANVRFDGGLTATDQDLLTISAGTYKLSADPAATTAHLTVVNNGTFDLGGLTANLAALTGTGTVANTSATAATLSVAGGSTLAGVTNGAGTFAGVIGNGTGGVALAKTGTGTFTLTGVNTYTGSTTVTGGTLDASGGAIDSAVGAMSVTNAGSFLIAKRVAPTSLNIGTGATVQLTNTDHAGDLTGRSTAGTLVNTGLLDVGGTGIIVASTLDSAAIRAQIIAGRGSAGGVSGAWTGTSGITSSVAKTDGANRAVGYFINGAQVVIAQTLMGDSTLDGRVNVLDRAAYLSNAGGSGKGWQQADFNFDGFCNVLDRAAYLSHTGQSLP